MRESVLVSGLVKTVVIVATQAPLDGLGALAIVLEIMTVPMIMRAKTGILSKIIVEIIAMFRRGTDESYISGKENEPSIRGNDEFL